MIRWKRVLIEEPDMNAVPQIPTLEEAYTSYRPLLFDAFARFGRLGLAVLPTDAMDLIHDFFLEAWEKVTANYDPSKGRLEPYVYGAFVHFARPRVARLFRLQRALVDPAQLQDVLDERDSAEPAFASQYDREVVAKTLDKLSSEERKMLLDYFGSDRLSERSLARKYHFSRYKLREELLGALGNVIVLLNRHEEFPQSDWKIAHCLWQEHRSIAETAGYLDLTETQVRYGHQRNLRVLARLLEEYRSGRFRGRSTTMQEQQEQTRDVCQLLWQVLLSPGNKELLEEAEKHSGEILAAIEGMEGDEHQESAVKEIDPQWVAQVYSKLAAAHVQKEDTRVFEALFDARKEDERSIGEAFEEWLLPFVSEPLRDFESYFRSLPLVTDAQRKLLLESPAVLASKSALELTQWGITPMTIFSATEAVGALVDRKLRRGKLASGIPIGLSKKNRPRQGIQVLDYQTAAREVRFVTRCHEKTGLWAC